MKCEVCGHKIPIGSKECPNCGFKLENNSQVTFNQSPVNNNRINIQNRVKKKNNTKWDFNIQTIVTLIIVVASIAALFVALTSVFFYSNDYESMNFTYVVDEDFDDNYSTVENANEYENYVQNYLYDNGFEYLDVEEEIKENDSSLIANCTVRYEDEHQVIYAVSFMFIEGKQVSLDLLVTTDLEYLPVDYAILHLDKFDDLLDRNVKMDIMNIRNKYMNEFNCIDYSDDDISVFEEDDDGVRTIRYQISKNGYIL